MRIRQYVTLTVTSETSTVQDITDALGLTPDRSSVLASRSAEPPIPRFNVWTLVVDVPGLRVEELLDQLLDRVGHLASRIHALGADGACSVELGVVRRFNDDQGEDEQHQEVEVDGGVLQGLGGQHQLLGWHLDTRVIDFLRQSRAELDVDEYG